MQVHCKWHLPNPDGSAGLTAPPDVVSQAAIWGGTTTMIDFARANQGPTVEQALAKREEDWKGHCATDYCYHIMVGLGTLFIAIMLVSAIEKNPDSSNSRARIEN